MRQPPRKLLEIGFTVWALLALASLLPVTLLLKASFPIFTVVWLLMPLGAVWLTKDPERVGFRPLAWRSLAEATALNLFGLLLIMTLFEPWSHTYARLLSLALAGQAPDTTFAWLLRYPRSGALGGMFLYSGLVTLFGEELFFRGWLLHLLQRRYGTVWAIVGQALCFTLPNLPAAFALPAMQGWLYALVYTWLAVGVVGGWAAARTKSIWPSLISATVCNLVLVAAIT